MDYCWVPSGAQIEWVFLRAFILSLFLMLLETVAFSQPRDFSTVADGPRDGSQDPGQSRACEQQDGVYPSEPEMKAH